MEEIEIWKSLDFLGFSNYKVSNMGRVCSLDRIINFSDGRAYKFKGRILTPTKDNKGYYRIVLSKNSKGITFKVHRLVALAFLENPNNLPQVNHKNEIKTDNRVENLEFCDNYYNCNYGTKNERQREKMKGENNYFYGKKHNEETKQKLREANSKPIIQYTLDDEFVKEWDSATQVERKLGYCKTSISKACKNQQKTAYGYIWRFK